MKLTQPLQIIAKENALLFLGLRSWLPPIFYVGKYIVPTRGGRERLCTVILRILPTIREDINGYGENNPPYYYSYTQLGIFSRFMSYNGCKEATIFGF